MKMTQDIGMVILLKSPHNSAPPLKQRSSSTRTPCFLWLMNTWNFVECMNQLVGGWSGGGGGGGSFPFPSGWDSVHSRRPYGQIVGTIRKLCFCAMAMLV